MVEFGKKTSPNSTIFTYSSSFQSLFNNLYIHIPFCSSKCSYCAFYSLPNSSEKLIDEYLKYLQKKFKIYSSQCNKLQSIYIGGGTPTLLNPKQLEFLFTSILNNFKLDNTTEISIECNPETITPEKAKILSNFVSLNLYPSYKAIF